MKFRNHLVGAPAIACAIAATAFAGCDDKKDGPVYPDSFEFKQELRVEQWSTGETNAFADFIGVNTAGMEVSVELPKSSSIYANGRQLTYEAPDAEDSYSYAYSTRIPGTPSEVTFTFNRTPSLALVNSIRLDNVPIIRLQPGSTIENDVNYKYTSSIPSVTNASIRIFLIKRDGSDAGKTYNATLFGDSYYFSGVPQGNYVLRSMSTITINTLQQPNGRAGGLIEATKVYELGTIAVK